MQSLFKEILKFNTDKGGLNAEKGFDFQYACALFDMIERYKANKNFIICIENVDDYIIVEKNNNVIIKQCKNYKTWACNVNNLLKKPKDKESIWEKMVSIYKRLKDMLGDKVYISYMLIINKKNNISILVESEGKEACKTEKFVDYLSLNEINEESKQKLKIGGNIDWDRFFIKRLLSYDTFEDEVKVKLYDAINDKKGISAKYNPTILYRSLLADLKDKSRKRQGVDLQQFIKNIDQLIEMPVDRFLSYSDVRDCNNYTGDFDMSRVNGNYIRFRAILNSRVEGMEEIRRYNEVKTHCNEDDFDSIVENCKKNEMLFVLKIEELLAYILLAKGEKYGISY